VAPGIEVRDAFSFACAAGDDCSAYVTIANRSSTADSLIGISTAEVGRAGLHATVRDDQGMMVMRPVERVDVAAGATIQLRPGGTHVMLYGLKRELKSGSVFQMTLRFAKAGQIAVPVFVKGAN
jgi:copper(I)-binding protein